MGAGDLQSLHETFTRGQMIDVIQTAAILAVCAVLVYAIWRLEGQVRAWARMLAEINAGLADKLTQQSQTVALGEQLALAWERILKAEARLEALERDRPAP